MDETKAEALANLLGGTTWNSGGNLWLVILRRSDGKVVAISDELVAEYADEESLGDGEPGVFIGLV